MKRRAEETEGVKTITTQSSSAIDLIEKLKSVASSDEIDKVLEKEEFKNIAAVLSICINLLNGRKGPTGTSNLTRTQLNTWIIAIRKKDTVFKEALKNPDLKKNWSMLVETNRKSLPALTLAANTAQTIYEIIRQRNRTVADYEAPCLDQDNISDESSSETVGYATDFLDHDDDEEEQPVKRTRVYTSSDEDAIIVTDGESTESSMSSDN